MDLSSLDSEIRIPFPNNEIIRSIKSNHNNQILSVKQQPINEDTYAIQVNDKCLQVYTGDYNLDKCFEINNVFHPQYFEAKRIMNSGDAKSIMNSSQLNDTGYPYTIFKHKSTKQCLSLDDTGLYLDKCNSNTLKQKWSVSPNENLCVDK